MYCARCRRRSLPDRLLEHEPVDGTLLPLRMTRCCGGPNFQTCGSIRFRDGLSRNLCRSRSRPPAFCLGAAFSLCYTRHRSVQVFGRNTRSRTATKPHAVTNGMVASLAAIGAMIAASSQIIALEPKREIKLITRNRKNCTASIRENAEEQNVKVRFSTNETHRAAV